MIYIKTKRAHVAVCAFVILSGRDPGGTCIIHVALNLQKQHMAQSVRNHKASPLMWSIAQLSAPPHGASHGLLPPSLPAVPLPLVALEKEVQVTTWVPPSTSFFPNLILPQASVFWTTKLPTKSNRPEQPGQVQVRSEKCPNVKVLPHSLVVNLCNGAGKHHNVGPREKWPFVQVEMQGGARVGLLLFMENNAVMNK